MLEVKCKKCGLELTQPGGLAFSPPVTTLPYDCIFKFHLCKTCWDILMVWLSEGK